MKKIILVFCLLFTFFLSPVKADSTVSFTANCYITGPDGTTTSERLVFTFESRYDNLLQFIEPRSIYNPQNFDIPCSIYSDTYQYTFNGTFESETYLCVFNYGDFPIGINNFAVTSLSYTWYEPVVDPPSSEIDLSTIQNYLLIISFLLFINFLRG